MKTIQFLLVAFSISIATLANAQVKKKVVKKTTPTATAKPAVDQNSVKNTNTSNVTAETKAVLSDAKAENNNNGQLPSGKSPKKMESVPQAEQPYRAAMGVKFLWGISLTGKHFIKPHQALEAIIRYKGYKGLGNDLAFSALYEYEQQISGAEGLNWYAGGGAYFGHFSSKSKYDTDFYGLKISKSYYGVSAVVGLEYKIKQLPIAISADWMPSFDIKGSAFVSENGGIGVKYTF